MVATDGSPHSSLALTWGLDNVVSPLDHLDLVTVALPPPFPVSQCHGGAAPALTFQ
jgi:hypothetical protein